MTTVTGKRVILKNLQDEYLIPFTDQGGSGNPDNETIILNEDDALRAIKVMDQGQEEPYAFREVTAQEYAAMKEAGTLDPHTYYNVPDVDDIVVDVNSKANQSLDNLNEAGQAIINGKANTSLTNLTADGEKHFLNKTQITNCILESPNGIATYSGSTVTVKEGLKVLIPNGRNTDGTLKTIEKTLSSDLSVTIDSSRSGDLYIFLNDGDILGYWDTSNVGNSEVTPASGVYWQYFNSEQNIWKETLNGAAYTENSSVIVAKVNVTAGSINSLTTFQSVDLLKRSDKAEISGWGMPSGRYVDLTLGASGSTYTAPANGWFFLSGERTASTDSSYSTSVTLTKPYPPGDTRRGYPFSTRCICVTKEVEVDTILPVRKGDIVYAFYLRVNPLRFQFYYAEGSEND